MQIKPFQTENFIANIAQNKAIFGALIFGAEPSLISIYSKKIAKSIVPNLADPFLVVNLKEAQIEEDVGLLADEFAAIAMLGGRKIIITEASSRLTESLKMIFENPAKTAKKSEKTTQQNFRVIGDNFILINGGNLDKNSPLRKFCETSPYLAAIACYEDEVATLSAIIRQKFREHKLTFDNQAIEALLHKFGKNRQIILNEIDKLILFLGNKTNVTVAIIEESLADIAEISIFQLVEEFANKNPKKSLFFLENLFIEKTSPITIIRILTAYFNKILLAKFNLQNGSNFDLEMKIQGIFFKQQSAFKKHLEIWSTKAVKNLLIKLQDLEIKCQDSNFDSELLLAAFINFVLIKKT